MSNLNLSKLSTSNIVELYNILSEKPVNRFSSRAVAEKRLRYIIEECPDRDVFEAEMSATTTKNIKMAEAVSKSWNVISIAEARSKRHAVIVDGNVFKSVTKALNSLGLSHPNIRKFRAEIVRNGKAKHMGRTFILAA